jgi:hypothetical protein
MYKLGNLVNSYSYCKIRHRAQNYGARNLKLKGTIQVDRSQRHRKPTDRYVEYKRKLHRGMCTVKKTQVTRPF